MFDKPLLKEVGELFKKEDEIMWRKVLWEGKVVGIDIDIGVSVSVGVGVGVGACV